MFQSLFWKISLSVGFVVTSILSIFAFYHIQNQKSYFLGSKIREMQTLSILINNGLTSFMTKEGTKDFHNFVNLFRTSDDRMQVRILDETGTVLYSSHKMEEGTSMSYLIPDGTLQDKNSRPPFIQEVRGKSFLSSIQMLRNEPVCFSCHGTEKKFLGFVHVSLPMEATRQSIRFHRNLFIASTAVTLLLMGLAVNLLLTRLVKEPTAKLIQTMAQVEKGNLNVRLNLRGRDELGRLAENFTSMVQKLSAAQEEVRRQHRQQMEQVQHLASLGELAASVAHEIRNPLAGIRLAIQVLSKESGREACCRDTMVEIQRLIDRMDRTVTDLLLYSRVRPPEMRSFSLPEVIEDALSSLREEFQSASVRVEKIFDPSLPRLSLDPEQMVSVFWNLFRNAVQAMPGGGTLKIETSCCQWGYLLQKGIDRPGKTVQEIKWAEVDITDTGGGMDPEVLKQIFRPFFTTKAKGTGLGLSLTKRIVEQHHGRIFAESEIGKGAKFSLLFPLFSPEAGGVE